MRLEVDIDGTVQTVDVDMDTITLREAVTVEKLVGAEAWDEYLQGKRRPSVIYALLQSKLARHYPDIEPDSFDIDFIEFTAGGSNEEDTDSPVHPTNGS